MLPDKWRPAFSAVQPTLIAIFTNFNCYCIRHAENSRLHRMCCHLVNVDNVSDPVTIAQLATAVFYSFYLAGELRSPNFQFLLKKTSAFPISPKTRQKLSPSKRKLLVPPMVYNM